ncbi:MAG: class I SAM-dependent methyltransferase [Cyanobacteria bacterium J06606_4]
MYDQAFWDGRYGTEKYLYGKSANTFLSENIDLLSGPVLSLSEGEGRNAVFMASYGLSVLGVDCSKVGLEKAQSLAKSKGVAIKTEVADLAHYRPTENHYGSVVSIFAHLPSSIRLRLYPLVEAALKPNGIVLLEAYSESQLGKDTGGPKAVDMLMSAAKLRREFPALNPILVQEMEREVVEGEGHTGMASVVRFIGRKEG